MTAEVTPAAQRMTDNHDDDRYPVGVVFDNRTFVVELSRDELEQQMNEMSLADVVRDGVVSDLPRNSTHTLVGEVHARARQWLQDTRGVDVNKRGAVRSDAMAEYLAAHGFESIEEAAGTLWFHKK